MNNVLLVLLILSAVSAIVFLIKYMDMKKSVRKLADQVREKTENDTNTLISVSGSDKNIKELAIMLNRELKTFREEGHRFRKGDNEVKEAVANISHDLRTPITAMSGYLELLEREPKSEAVDRYISIINERCQALKSLTEELFDYSVTASKADNLVLTPICLNEELELVLASFYAVLTEAGIEPQISITEKKVIRQLDKGAFGRVLGNIINNALKYSNGDLVVSLEEDGTIICANTAPNMTPVDTARLFERFYTVRTAKGSTGLGLSIARMLTGKMNGSIHAEYNNGMLEIIIKF